MSNYSNWLNRRDNFVQAQGLNKYNPVSLWYMGQGFGANPGADVSISPPQEVWDENRRWTSDWAGLVGDKFKASLTPQEWDDYNNAINSHNASISKQGSIIKPLALATIAASGLGAAGQAAGLSGLFGGGAEAGGLSGIDAAMADMAASGAPTISAPASSAATAGSGLSLGSGLTGPGLSVPAVTSGNTTLGTSLGAGTGLTGPGLTAGGSTLGSGLTAGTAGGLSIPSVTAGNAVLGTSLADGLGLTGMGLKVPAVTAGTAALGSSLSDGLGLSGPGLSASDSLANMFSGGVPSTSLPTGNNTLQGNTNTPGNFNWNSFLKDLVGNLNVPGLVSSIAGLYSSNQNNNNLENLVGDLKGLYGPNSAYEQQLRQELERRDAASGRRSQYGPRAVELQSRLAQLASGQTQQLNDLYGQINKSNNNQMNSLLNIFESSGIFNKINDIVNTAGD